MNTENFRYSDGGRMCSGFADERLDCTIRAYALAMDISYEKSHNILEQFGRKPQCSCSFSTFMQKKHPEITHYETSKPRPRVKTVFKKTFLKNAIVRISGHCFCVKNNIALDMTNRRNCIITDIWYFD